MSIQYVPVVECTYGWGQKATLYHNRLEANNTVYPLAELMYVEPVYLRFVGISSIRLKLFFKHQMLVLRGLTNSEPVQKMIKYLTSFICSPTQSTINLSGFSGTRTAQTLPQQALMAPAHVPFWDYNSEETSPLGLDKYMQTTDVHEECKKVSPMVLSSSEVSAGDYGMTEEYEITKSIKRIVLSDLSADDASDSTDTNLLALYGELILPEIVYLPEHIEYRPLRHSNSYHAEVYTSDPSAATAMLVPATLTDSSASESRKRAVQMHVERERQRLKRLQVQHEIRVFGFSVEGLIAQLRQGQLPCIDVSLPLLPGEIAHYRADATLCEEPAEAGGHEETMPYYPIKYRIKDRGSFILTNARILYLGRKRHMLLGYEQLLHVSHWHDFMALTLANFQKRQLFEMRRPLECILYLEYLLRRYLATSKIETGEVASISSPSISVPETLSSIRTRALARMGGQIS